MQNKLQKYKCLTRVNVITMKNTKINVIILILNSIKTEIWALCLSLSFPQMYKYGKLFPELMQEPSRAERPSDRGGRVN